MDESRSQQSEPTEPVGSTYRYRIFISYSHEDRRQAQWLMRKLEGYRTPRRLAGTAGRFGRVPARLAPVFRDREELSSGDDLSTAITDALADSAMLLVVASPAAARSDWVRQEIIEFKRRGPRPVFAYVVDGDPGAESGPDVSLPEALRRNVLADGSLDELPVEPLAADARRAGDGRTAAMQKLVAGLLGVPLNDLVRRENQRRQQKLLAVTLASVAGMSVAVVLAAMAMLAREDADRRRDQAEDLLAFMVGDLRQSLEPIGRLALLERVGSKALDYFATVDPSDVSNQGLARQAQVLTQIGSIRLAELRFAEAGDAFAEAYRRSARLAEADPDNGTFLFERAQAEYWIADAAWRNGDLRTAETWFARYRDTAVELLSLEPQNRAWRREAGYGHHNLGAVAVKGGNPQQAIASFSRELELLQELSAGRPLTERIHDDIVDCLSWLASANEVAGNLPDALDYFGRSRTLAESLLSVAPDDSGRTHWLANLLMQELMLARQLGDAHTLEAMDRAIALQQQLVAMDPDNRRWQVRYHRFLLTRAEWRLAAGADAGSVGAGITASIGVLEIINAQHGGSDEESKLALAAAHRLLAQAGLRQGSLQPAIADIDIALGLLSGTDEAVNVHGVVMETAISHRVAYRIYLADGRGDRAQDLRRNAMTLLAPVMVNSRLPRLLEEWAHLLHILGDEEQAAQVRDGLAVLGYQPLWGWPETAD